MPHIDPTQQAGAALARRLGLDSGPVVMLNLLRFRETADYSGAPELAPEAPISGEEAYRRYSAGILPLLLAAGGEVLFHGSAAEWFIGPEAERWDHVLLVKQVSVGGFFGFASDPAAQAVMGHRTAALEDSRLLPIVQD